MRVVAAPLRISLTVAILVALLIFITPAQAIEDLQGANWRWTGAALALSPLFLFCRFSKWMLLERQVLGPSSWGQGLQRYLWGMAVGLVTPGRVGELARVGGPKRLARGTGLFFLEKAVEVSCLFGLCLLSLSMLEFVPPWTVLPMALVLGLALTGWRRLLSASLVVIGRLVGWPAPERRKHLASAVSNLRIRGCALLSLVCFVIYIIQAYLVLRALGVAADPQLILLFPIVLLANLVPITVAGYGVRETLAVVVLQFREVPEMKAAASVAFVTFFNLVVPGVAGLLMRGLGKGTTWVQHTMIEHNDGPADAKEWDRFWEARRRHSIGRLLAWFRQKFVTTALAKYIRRNTDQGTLIEAGCGSGEVALQVAAERGDQVVLVDCSPQALALAGRLARGYGIDAKLVECDIAELGAHVPAARENIVYNIGVIEHFQDPSHVLREMADVSGRYAIAVIPERSLFWLVFTRVSRLLGLVPRDFFVRFFGRKQLADLVIKAGLRVRWLRGVRIFGLIPYLGVCYSPASCVVEQEHNYE